MSAEEKTSVDREPWQLTELARLAAENARLKKVEAAAKQVVASFFDYRENISTHEAVVDLKKIFDAQAEGQVTS